MDNKIINYRYLSNEKERLDNYLNKILNNIYSRSYIQKLINNKVVFVNNQIVDKS
jgi:23S rRNA-/tRNA-specific pseudouridylate synthase